MGRHLVFSLCAPLGAWGTASPSSGNAAYKATDLVPGKSAVIGLLGAALGWPRDRLGELASGLTLAVRIDVSPVPQPAPDYHTVRKGQPPKGRERWSRFDELRSVLTGRDDDGAMLSRREFLAEGLWTVALHPADGIAVEAAVTVETLAEALRRPVFPLCAGRKAFTLGLPPDPAVIEADGPMEAVAAYGWPWTRRPAMSDLLDGLHRRMVLPLRLHADADYPGLSQSAERWIERRDVPVPMTLESGHNERRFRSRRELHLFCPVP